MRRFHSYGPVDGRYHFCVPREALVAQCVSQMIGVPDEGGHFFTIWAPRQTGKTWLMRQAQDEIARRYSDRFVFGAMSMQGIIFREAETGADAFLSRVPRLFQHFFGLHIPAPASWEEFTALFSREAGVFEKPVILFIDEFDSLPREVIDRVVTLFREIYLNRGQYSLHGLALIGVRAVLGVESLRGSPFNIQRSLHVPNLTREETTELFRQYQEESGQSVEPAVVAAVHDATRGQPGLVSWFGELLTETYNPGAENSIGWDDWKRVYARALHSEWNNTILNLVKKVRAGYTEPVLSLFGRSDLPFRLDADWCSYLYLNGVIDKETLSNDHGEYTEICRFSCPFIQERLYHALTDDLIGDHLPILVLEPLDDLADVFSGPELNVPALMERYRGYLGRLKAAGIDPWTEQPRRVDLRLTEAVGHFHLFAWLKAAVDDRCVVSPEFPTGNGRVDLHLRCGTQTGVIEVKSFQSLSRLERAKRQAAEYARKLGRPDITVALFAAVADESVIARLSGAETVAGIRVTIVAIRWG